MDKLALKEILKELKSLSDPKALEGMARFGININNTYGVSIPELRALAKKIGKSHELAQGLWASGIHEARILAGMVDDPEMVTEKQLDEWASEFDSWDVCDQCCSNLFGETRFAYKKAFEWSSREEEFVKRAGFAMMAVLAVHDKNAKDEEFMKFLPVIKRKSVDERNFVKKAVNWALRQIGKRNSKLNRAAVKAAEEIEKMNSKSAKWIASDALRELTSHAVKKRL
ncbi:MAG: DNA alkylation repair protein [Candidatus Micrarchaeota archaeon]|nr:DNA alkylation repair protein [Candidatus Micrarchaeota archaeon]